MEDKDNFVNILLKEVRKTVKRTNLMFWRWADYHEVKINEN